MSRKLALIIGNSRYEDANLSRLATPSVDVEALAGLLRNSDIGEFDEVRTVVNEPMAAVRLSIAQFFARRTHDDLLLLYFSGHGVRDEDGKLYLAQKDTQRDFLNGTAIQGAFITEEMDRCRSRRQLLILDCCHSGAFHRGAKGALGTSVGTKAAFEGTGYGRVVLTATDATQYAWEGDQVLGKPERSVFTKHLIHGLESGEADIDGDGQISVDELYDYVHGRVVAEKPEQTPGKWTYRQQGDLIIARNPRPAPKAAELPLELTQAMENRLAGVRQGTVSELGHLLGATHRGLALAARAALEKLKDDDSRRVSRAATESLEAHGKADGQLAAHQQAEAELAAQQKAEQERLERERVEQGRLAREQAEAERAAQEKVEQERQAREKAEAERAAQEKADAERIAREKIGPKPVLPRRRFERTTDKPRSKWKWAIPAVVLLVLLASWMISALVNGTDVDEPGIYLRRAASKGDRLSGSMVTRVPGELRVDGPKSFDESWNICLVTDVPTSRPLKWADLGPCSE